MIKAWGIRGGVTDKIVAASWCLVIRQKKRKSVYDSEAHALGEG